MKEIKMSFNSKNGKTIIKNVPENIAAYYIRQGWQEVKEVKEQKPKIEPKSSFSNRESD